jgi:RsiW-degrading membrane proteinase PrsW (M82 family)
MGTDAWIVLSIVISFFLLLAAAQHVVEIVKEKNHTPGNTVILIYDIGLPISLWALLLANGSIGS